MFSGLLQEGEQSDAELKTFSFPQFWLTLTNTIRSSQPCLGLQDIAQLEFNSEMKTDSASITEVSSAH